ncbi:helix-turn-helix domain-containing protein [Vibrio jasicida]|uniref:Transcriptional regulator n=1 Tax=Vibrio jasicida TaxID=766224 RepID=A0ABW7JEW0_9VIBR
MNLVKQSIDNVGGVNHVSKEMNISSASVSHWVRDNAVPLSRLVEFEQVTGTERHFLAPDLFKGYMKIGSDQVSLFPTISNSILFLANDILKIANEKKSCQQSIKDCRNAMLKLYEIAKCLDMSEKETSILFTWSEMLSSNETTVTPVNHDLILERGGFDPFVINKTFMPG